MHIRVGDVVSLIIRDRFGQIIEQIAYVLQMHGSLTLNQIKRITDLPLSKVKEALCILIKYKLVSFERCSFKRSIAEYALCIENVLRMLRYPQYMILIKKKFGDQSEMIIEELLQNGYLTAGNTILNIAERLNCEKSELSTIKDKFVSLAVAKYIERIKLSEEDEHPVPVLEIPKSEMPDQLSIDMHLLTQAHMKKIDKKELPANEYWTVNFDRFHQDMRDQCIVDAFTNRIDDNAGEFVKLLIQQMYIRTDPWAESSNPVPLSEIKRVATKKVTHPNLITFFDQYVNIIEQDNHDIIVKAGEASGGSFQIHLKKAFTVLAWEVVEQVILQKFDSKATRIFRLVKEKEFIDPEQLQQLVMIPSKDAKKISYELVQEKFLKIKDFKKPTSNSGPVKSPTLFYIELESIVENLYSLCFKTLYNLIAKRNHEYDTNKRLLDKKQRCNMIVLLMKSQGATEEQIAEFEENITPPEREIITKVEKNIKKLNLAELEMDHTIFILEMYLKYTFSKVRLS
ncbi:DNA-directed RNA polymerase III subunit RPC3 [Coccinella septempunctata]|uniref:DNA-directed RNA polymerase III subunit RPC3 n=1 Tax=Coccinella septempunctata TaxID=41139 RepID=UPI001D08D7D4|nr:DNA-directed RNA polymerase III subunit RPC3 [Coccinella septempunctata]